MSRSVEHPKWIILNNALARSYANECDTVTSDFETTATGSLNTHRRVQSSVGLLVHYLTKKDDVGAQRIIDDMSLPAAVAAIHCHHSKRAALVGGSGSDSEGRCVTTWSAKWASESGEGLEKGGGVRDNGSSSDEEVSSKRPPDAPPASKKRVLIRAAIPEERQMDVIKDTVVDVHRLVPTAEPSVVFQEIADRAGLPKTLRYVLRCGKSPEQAAALFPSASSGKVSVALIELGYHI